MGWKDVLFPASKGAIMNKGAAVAGGTGQVRMNKAPNIFQSIIGALIGIALVIGSPLIMWKAQSQHSAEDFASATQVAATSSESGYITFSGAPSYADADGGEVCVDADCVYQVERQEEEITVDDLVCGNNVKSTDTMRVLEQNGSECNENGDCVPCYDVERDEWQLVDSIETYYDVSVGNYTIDPTGATFLDLENETVDTGYSDNLNPTRSVYSYFNMPSTLLVAGNSDGETVYGGEMVFVLSQYNSELTLQKLEARDSANQKGLWIITFFMLFVGIGLILGPLAWAGRQMRFIPVIGPMLAKGSSGMIIVAALIVSVPLWILLFVIVTLIKSWWLAVLLVILVGLFFYWRSKKQ